VSSYARVIIGSISGTCFFAIWPFVYFYIEIHNYSEFQLLIAYLILSSIAVASSVILVGITKYDFLMVSISLVCFILSVIVSQTEEKKIENAIAIYTNYYSDSIDELKIIESQNKNAERVLYAAKNLYSDT